ncbi:MAG: ATP-binding protein [Patescibacteria group bacterium]|jgi:predicted kinase
MRKVIIGIGIPGSGKTKALKELAEKFGYAYVCPDDIRAKLLGNTTDQSKGDEVWDEAYNRVATALAEGQAVVFDATFTNEPARLELINFAREHGADKIQGIRIDAPLEVAKERNQSRDRVVPEHVLERMDAKLHKNEPNLGEGFDSIFTLNEFQQLQRIEMEGQRGKIEHRV